MEHVAPATVFTVVDAERPGEVPITDSKLTKDSAGLRGVAGGVGGRVGGVAEGTVGKAVPRGAIVGTSTGGSVLPLVQEVSPSAVSAQCSLPFVKIGVLVAALKKLSPRSVCCNVSPFSGLTYSHSMGFPIVAPVVDIEADSALALDGNSGTCPARQ
jgi:hypothetical protein